MNMLSSCRPEVSPGEIVSRARGLRELLRSQQDATESKGYPTQTVYDAITATGLFKTVRPKRYGGYELPLKTFYEVVIEIARGCPNTGWWFALGTGHNVQAASYFPQSAQDEIFRSRASFQAPWSFHTADATAEVADGGYRIGGTWNYCSGIPYASHFMGTLALPDGGDTAGKMLAFVVPDGSFKRLDNWGHLLGMKGCGSHSARVEDVFVPNQMTFILDPVRALIGPTLGAELHSNPLYGGNFSGFAEGGLAAVAVGLAYATLDEYEELVATKNTPGTNTLRALNEDYLRSMGRAVSLTDTARAAVLHGAEQFVEYAREAMNGVSAFSDEKANRLDGVYHTVEALVNDAVQILVRTASTSALTEGSRIARYMHGSLMLVSRGHDQFEFRAAAIAKAMMRRKRELNYA